MGLINRFDILTLRFLDDILIAIIVLLKQNFFESFPLSSVLDYY